jgi:hypothetical protein
MGRIFTTYFTSRRNPIRNVRVEKDCFPYVEAWHDSLHAAGLHGTIFHDGLSDAFVAAHRTARVDFVFEDPSRFTYSLNDERFFIYLRHLLARPEIESLFMTDGSDVIVAADPFPSLAAGKVYAGSEDATLHPPPPADDEIAFGHHTYAIERLEAAGLHDFLAWAASREEALPVLNAGILGGRRDVVLAVLERITETLAAIGKPWENLNMGVFNYVLYTFFKDRLVTGAPVHSVFGAYERDRKDVWFIHK